MTFSDLLAAAKRYFPERQAHTSLRSIQLRIWNATVGEEYKQSARELRDMGCSITLTDRAGAVEL